MIRNPARNFQKIPIKNSFKLELVNLLNNSVNYSKWTVSGTGTTKDANGIHLVDDGSAENSQINITLRPAVLYTLVYTVTSKNLTTGFFSTGGVGALPVNQELQSNVGLNKIVMTTNNPITSNLITLKIGSGFSGDYVNLTDIMLFEGDQRNNPEVNQYIPYIG